MAVEAKLVAAIQALLPDAEVELETTSSGRVGGFVLSSRFEDLAQMDRQRLLWGGLEQVLTKEEQLRVVSLITLTHEEAREADDFEVVA